MGVPKEIFNRVPNYDPSLHQAGASDVEDALIAPSEAGSSAPASRDPSPPNFRRRIKTPRRTNARGTDVRGLADSRVGVRAVRRKQNNQFLLALIEEEEEGLPELRDQPTVPAFTQLFLDKKNMLAWSEFISLSEEQQEEYLKELNRNDYREDEEDGVEDEEESLPDCGEWELLDEARGATAAAGASSSVDARLLHPAADGAIRPGEDEDDVAPSSAESMLSPEECFERVEMRFRAMLRKRHVPLGILANLEEDLTSFFSECPRSVWISRLSSSYERLLLHALCQYLDLKSSSFDQDKARHTQVENHNVAFSPPRKSLHQHLEDMRLEKSVTSTTSTEESKFGVEEDEVDASLRKPEE